MQGDVNKALEHHAQDLAIAKVVGNRSGKGKVYGNLGSGHMHLMMITFICSCRNNHTSAGARDAALSTLSCAASR